MAKSRLLGAALRRRDLDPRARVDQQHAGLGLLELEAAGDRAERLAAAAAEQPAERAADAAGVVLAEHDRGRDDEVGRDHLALADVLVSLQLARSAKRTLLHHVAHADAALDDLEAVRLLDHRAQHRRRRAEAVALQVLADLALRLDDRQRAFGRIAALELVVGALCLAVGPRAPGGDRAALAERLRRGRAGSDGEEGKDEGEFRGHGLLLGDGIVPRRRRLQPSGPCLSASDVNESA